MIGPHISDKHHHFEFSANVNDEYLTKLKNNINKFEDLIMMKVDNVNEDEIEKFQPDHDDQHCQKCKNSGSWSRWLDAQ